MAEKLSDLSQKVEAAFQAAAEIAVERARQTGTPVIIWRDGRVTELPYEEALQLLNSAKKSAP